MWVARSRGMLELTQALGSCLHFQKGLQASQRWQSEGPWEVLSEDLLGPHCASRGALDWHLAVSLSGW